jgi:membrane fusion protein, multidrug efflux system
MRSALLAVPILLAAVAACTRPTPPVVPPATPSVKVIRPVLRLVTDAQDFTGRARASDSVDIKARVTGDLKAVGFTEGAMVKGGQTLFTLDPGLYETALYLAHKDAEAKDKKVTATKRLVDQFANQGTEVERATANFTYVTAQAEAEVAHAQEKQAQRQFDYTKIAAPKGGRIGRHLIDVGGPVKADETVLANVVVTDPMHVYFDVDDLTLQELKTLQANGRLDLTAGSTKVKVAVPGQDGFPPPAAAAFGLIGGAAAAAWPTRPDGLPHEGYVGSLTFIDSKLSDTTGTITLRADVPNPNDTLTPNVFVRVRLPLGAAKPRLLVPEEAIGTDQGLKFVFVVNAEDKVEYRQVIVGRQEGTLVVVSGVPGKANTGVTETDRVIVEGLQRVRREMTVTIR